MKNGLTMFNIENSLIAISTLNDFIFCPYSIYLHNVFAGTDEDVYYALPQIKGKEAHSSIDTRTNTLGQRVIESLSVQSVKFGLYGIIDLYFQDTGELVERKNNLKTIFIGQIYQLWAQCISMQEMGYDVRMLSFYEITTRKRTPIDLPNEQDLLQFSDFLNRYRTIDLHSFKPLNANKCNHCIYCALCDKSTFENVY